MRLFDALITPTTLSLPCRRRKTAVVRSTTARCRCRRSGRRRGRQTCPCARRRGRRRHGGHAAPCARCRCSTGANCSALGARLGAAVHKCGQRAVVEPPAIAVAALVDVVAGQVDADVGVVGRQYASARFSLPNKGRARSRRSDRNHRLHGARPRHRRCARTANGYGTATTLRAPTSVHERAEMVGHRRRECLITDGKRLRSGVTTLFQLDW